MKAAIRIINQEWAFAFSLEAESTEEHELLKKFRSFVELNPGSVILPHIESTNLENRYQQFVVII